MHASGRRKNAQSCASAWRWIMPWPTIGIGKADVPTPVGGGKEESLSLFRVLFLSNVSEYSCRIPGDNSIGRHIFGHHTTSANDSVLTHGNAA